jgi:4-amino-4-deoxy-L-arabinose transferase-like glycosyltransferase
MLLSQRILRAAIVIGLVVRLGILAFTGSLGTRIVDEQHYTKLAANLAAGDGFGWREGQLTSIRPPLFPALVGGVWGITGPGHFQIIRILNVLFWAICCWLVFKLGARVFSADVGRYAAAICWLYPSFVFFNFTILTETLFTLLLVAFVYLAIALIQTPTAWRAGFCGIVLGLAALTRSVLWPLPLVLCPFLLLAIRTNVSRRLALTVLLLAGYVAAIAPWAVRNTRLQGVPTVIDTMGGLNLRMGNYEFTPEDRMWDAATNESETGWAHQLRVEFPGQTLTEGQKDKWAQRKAIEYIREHPGTFIRRAGIKFADLWGLEREYAAGINHGLYSPPKSLGLVASALIVVAYAALTLMFAAGIWLAPATWRENALLLLPVVAITAAHTIVFGHSRYHMPLIPIMALYAAALFCRPARVWRGSLRTVAAALTGAVFLVIWGREIIVTEWPRIQSLFSHAG